MRLHAAATYFDKSVLTDAYTGSIVGKAQLNATDIFKLDGASVRRRLISVGPGVTPPTRMAVRLGGDVYLMGEPSADEHGGSPIRTNYVLHHTPGQATIKTLAEALGNAAGRTMWASREWNKDVADLQTSSSYFNDYHIFVAKTEAVAQENLIYVDGQWHICHAVHPSLSGFTDAVSHEILGTVFETVDVASRTYNPLTDAWTSSTVNAKVLRVRWQEKFEYLTKGQANYERGDETIVVLKAGWPAAKASDTLTLSDGTWRVLSVRDDGLTLALHARRA